MQQFWKSVEIWQSYREFKGGNISETHYTVITNCFWIVIFMAFALVLLFETSSTIHSAMKVVLLCVFDHRTRHAVTSHTHPVYTCARRQVWLDQHTWSREQCARDVVSFAHSWSSAADNLPVNVQLSQPSLLFSIHSPLSTLSFPHWNVIRWSIIARGQSFLQSFT